MKKELESKGYFVLRSAGSKSLIDLIAVRNGIPILFQCKSKELSKKERNELRKLKNETNCRIILVLKKNKQITYSDTH